MHASCQNELVHAQCMWGARREDCVAHDRRSAGIGLERRRSCGPGNMHRDKRANMYVHTYTYDLATSQDMAALLSQSGMLDPGSGVVSRWPQTRRLNGLVVPGFRWASLTR